MTKEIVYLDLADDITTITAKVTRGQGQLIALVLPKSLGALRNIVNLRLLTRVAAQHNKKIVLVSSNPEMLPLAGQVGLPVAKSLRDQPILPPKPEGEAERTIDEPLTDETESSATLTAAEVATVDAAAEQTTDETLGEDPLSDEHLVPKVKLAETETDTQVKSFKDWFKTHMWWIIAPVAALILLIVGVMVFVKPKATVEVLARTSKYNFSEKISFTKNEAEANPEQGIFFLIEQNLEKTSECELASTNSNQPVRKKPANTRVAKSPSTIPGLELQSRRATLSSLAA